MIDFEIYGEYGVKHYLPQSTSILTSYAIDCTKIIWGILFCKIKENS